MKNAKVIFKFSYFMLSSKFNESVSRICLICFVFFTGIKFHDFLNFNLHLIEKNEKN